MNKKKTLYNRILITLVILFISRLGIFIPIPGVNQAEITENINRNSIVNFLNIFSGGGFSTIGIFSLGIIPYINSSIITQLLIKVIPTLEDTQKNEGELGKQKINNITRYLTLVWAIIQSISIALWIKPYTFNWNINFLLNSIVTLTTGSIIIMWFAEVITEYGIGNGASMLIFQNIISNIPKNIQSYKINELSNNITTTAFVVCCIIVLIINIIIQDSKRKIKIISSKQLGETNRLLNNNYIPLKLNQGGVMPIIFASATITIPQYIAKNTLSTNSIFNNFITSNSFIYLTAYLILIIIFSYFYSSIILNTNDMSDNLKKVGASIPSIRPGQETVRYLKRIVNKLTFIGSIFLFIIAQFPLLLSQLVKINILQGLGTTSLLILVGVAIDTAKQIQTYIISEQYDNIME
uniref:Protein translocase subunit SecY n=1 Tax=Tolypiocladia glomerulata TaxID=860646 RepID=A0A1Z1MV03_9FLOR|nr:SecY-type transporter protein [Tolypiocladia glomerulata]ARW69796.1 SecY-type transporter protein [Tolypiocladia glomerulata]